MLLANTGQAESCCVNKEKFKAGDALLAQDLTSAPPKKEFAVRGGSEVYVFIEERSRKSGNGGSGLWSQHSRGKNRRIAGKKGQTGLQSSEPPCLGKKRADCVQRTAHPRELGKVGSLIADPDQSPWTQEGGLSKCPSLSAWVVRASLQGFSVAARLGLVGSFCR